MVATESDKHYPCYYLVAVRYNELNIVVDIFLFRYFPVPFVEASNTLIQGIGHYKYHREMK